MARWFNVTSSRCATYEQMTKSPLIVFDLDGTLVDTAPDLINALNFILAREGLPPVPLQTARTLIGAGAKKLIERGLEMAGRNFSVAEMSRLTDDFISHYAEHIADASRPFDGLEAALDDLKSRGHRFAVCTNKLEWLSKRLLDRLNLSERFAAIRQELDACQPPRKANSTLTKTTRPSTQPSSRRCMSSTGKSCGGSCSASSGMPNLRPTCFK